MPLPPTTVRYQCSACPWTKTVALRGNAVLPGQFFMACPQCGHKPLQTDPPDALTQGAAQAAQLLRGWIKSDGSL